MTRVLAALLLIPALHAQAPHRARNRASSIALRKRLHVNPLITEPDTLDFEWGGAFSTGGSFTWPAAIRYTPEGSHIYWGRTEFSASFDSLSSVLQPDGRINHFGDRATLAATCVVLDGDKLDIAVAPQVSVLLRGDHGVRAGMTGIARYDWGRSSAGVTFTWTGATASSDSNPAGTIDIGAGYGFQLKSRGPLSHLSPHANWLYEKSTGSIRQISLFEGVEYQITDAVAIDFSGQHLNAWGGPIDHQIVAGLTVSTGKLHRH